MPAKVFDKLKFFLVGVAVIGGCALVFVQFLYALNAQDSVGQDDEIEDEIGGLNQELEGRRRAIEELKQQAEEYRKKIVAERNEAFSLKGQIGFLDDQIARIKLEIKAKEQEIYLTKLDIKETEDTIERLQNEIEEGKERIAHILRMIYVNEEKSHLEILLMNDSLSDFFNEAKYIENLHYGLHDGLVALKRIKKALDAALVSLTAKKEALVKQKGILDEERLKLEEQEAMKEQLLFDTQASERKFRALLTDLKEEQEDINTEIVSLEKSIRQKIEEQERQKELEALHGEAFMWPVPKNTITAYFHDPDYPFRNVFEHPAIDIRAPQGTTVKAAASGYVAKTRKDPQCVGRYAYVMIIHANGLSTVYGHLNQIDVDEGQFVIQGQRIGLSGGRPRSCGAGRLTTGSHMHLEVRLNGIPVDPLGYMP